MTVLYDLNDRIAHITLNRPDQRNAFNRQLFADLDEAMFRFRDDDGARICVMDAAGAAFSVGFDIKDGDQAMTGGRVRSQEALSSGVISQLVDADALLSTALELAEDIARNAPMAITMTKEVMWANLHAASLDQALALESRTQNLTRHTADATEARAAFIEKRTPDFDNTGGKRPLR